MSIVLIWFGPKCPNENRLHPADALHSIINIFAMNTHQIGMKNAIRFSIAKLNTFATLKNISKNHSQSRCQRVRIHPFIINYSLPNAFNHSQNPKFRALFLSNTNPNYCAAMIQIPFAQIRPADGFQFMKPKQSEEYDHMTNTRIKFFHSSKKLVASNIVKILNATIVLIFHKLH